MKIIKQGTDPWWTGLQAKCHDCGQTYELDKNDHKLVTVTASRNQFCFICSNCEQEVIVNNPSK
jgi:DNA-directed RNA polymerase subunit RPC12/RpoP